MRFDNGLVSTSGRSAKGRRARSSHGGAGTGGKGRTLRKPDSRPERTEPAERRRIKKRGIALATAGLLFALGVAGLFSLVGVARVSVVQWVALLGATLVCQGALWLVPHLGLDERLTWDRHYIYLPMFVAALLLASYVYFTPEARYLMLMGWLAALLFTAGLAGFREIVALGALMTGAYLGAVLLRGSQGGSVSLPVESIRAGVFLGINVFGGFVSERLRGERRKMKELKEQLAERAVTDPLTGLRNRRYFEEFLESELARIRRYGGRCALAMVDIDSFKNYNDTLGHLAGDEVLKTLSRVLENRLRTSDVLSRYGGEEFAVIMVNTTRPDAAEVIDRLREYVEDHPFGGEEVQPGGTLTVSAGVAACPEDGTTYEELLRQADEALYRAKRRGRNRVHEAA